MRDFTIARSALHDAAIALDHIVELAVPDTRNARGRYERLTNTYQDDLISWYINWGARLVKSLNGDVAAKQTQIDTAIPELQTRLQQAAQEHMPYAVQAIGVEEYAPSPEAWHMMGDAIAATQADIATRLIPEIHATLSRALVEGADVEAIVQSLIPRVAFYAGALWIAIQRLVGDFAAQATTRDDLIYRCRWVLDPHAEHCPACLEFAGEYDSYAAMLERTLQAVPGYFAGYPGRACWLN